MSDLEIDINEIELNKVISQGGFSLVYNGIFRGTYVAVKKIFDPNITQDLLDELNNELKMLARLRHPNIVLIMGVVTKPPNLCIITEYLH
jgi:serine/threonine protein kinase